MLFGGSTKGIKFNQKGLIPAIVQDANTLKVLIYVYMNSEAIKKIRKTKNLWLYHRSMKKVWKKGGRSGHTMKVVDMMLHHDRNVMVVKVIPNGPACHTGNETCFMESYMNKDTRLDDRETSLPAGGDGLDILRKMFEHQEEVEVVTANTANGSGASSPEESGVREVAQVESAQRAIVPDYLEQVYANLRRKIVQQDRSSYPAKMAALGGEKIAQKIGENAMQLLVSIAGKSVDGIAKKEAEMMHNLLILLAEKQIELDSLKAELNKRVAM